jgi:myo-inositol-1(or 4)-monophosphatase
MRSELLKAALEAARIGGDILIQKLSARRQVRLKGFRDIVTDADVASQAAIAAYLGARCPEIGLIGEEDLGQSWLVGRKRLPRPMWVIDPLDGTSNYARQFPVFAVSIGLLDERRRPVLGVILDPTRNEVFYSAEGQGAWHKVGSGRPRRLSVSAEADLGMALVGTGFPRDQEAIRRAIVALEGLATHCQKIRALGSAALLLAYTAAGRLDATFMLGVKAWDVVAGISLIQEAGGQVRGPEGGPWHPDDLGIFASNARLYRPLRRLLFNSDPA